MSICSTCRTKGNCCKGFELSFEVSKDNWYNESIKILQKYNLEFMHPVAPRPDYCGENKVRVLFNCSRLGVDGLCTDYENRPDLCRLYEPKSDPLCCEYTYTLKGIPIAVESKVC